ncbi:MAG: threonine-phosphate decarboxylase CobD [Cohaesibacter sp.]|jgi:cobalamin biosynthetic protein CobC|nr:threonine-phosphate decarboxylase CobD [Cohaesibacter sp.]
MQDHGGNIDQAIQLFGGAPESWLDLSTGINRLPYPLPHLPSHCWTDLPTQKAKASLIKAAQKAYGTKAALTPLAGAQAAIQMLPRQKLMQSGPESSARILTPTYNEHEICARAAGWTVTHAQTLDELRGADLAIVVNPNNPDGQCHKPQDLLALANDVGTLIVDESFCDPRPDLSITPFVGEQRNLYVLRSFGKFFGLAGLRLGFILGHEQDIAAIESWTGPWPVSGAAIEIGKKALEDKNWASETISRLHDDCVQMDALAKEAGWQLVGGCELFRLYHTQDAAASQQALARSAIWSRIFPWSPTLVRLGLPGDRSEWEQTKTAFRESAHAI